MKLKTTALAIALLAFSTPSFSAETYTLDPSHTGIVWTINHMGFSNYSGKFNKAEGSVSIDEATPQNSKVKVTISVTDNITGDPKLEAHLKTPDFFDTAKFPTASFESTKVELTGKDTAKVTGNLTLHGVTKVVVLDTQLNKLGMNMMNKKTAGFAATTTIKRSDFNILKFLPMLGDEVKLVIYSEANLADTKTK